MFAAFQGIPCEAEGSSTSSSIRTSQEKGRFKHRKQCSNYFCLRKKMKDAKKLIASLKQMDNKFGASPLLHQDHQLSAVIQVIKKVHVKSCSIFQSLSLFLST